MPTKQDWEWLVFNSHYQTATAVQRLLQEGKLMEASIGLETLIEAMSRTERRAIRSQLTRLMSHIIKWKCQPGHRSRSWVLTILDARQEIEEIQEEVPSLNQEFVESIWEKCLIKAAKQAESEMDMSCEFTSLSWAEVFEDEYTLLPEDSE